MIWEAFGDNAMSAAKIKVWHKCFKDGQESVESDPHSGRPTTGRIPENVECYSAPLLPRFGTLRLLAFYKTKITFEKEEISDVDEIQ